MVRECSTPFDGEQLQRELQSMIREDAPAILHGLTCDRCGSRGMALKALSLVGWDESDFYAAIGVLRG